MTASKINLVGVVELLVTLEVYACDTQTEYKTE